MCENGSDNRPLDNYHRHYNDIMGNGANFREKEEINWGETLTQCVIAIS